MYAAGKIPGGFFKREGRATERATLTARMIDRPIRPLWPKGFRNEVQVICTVALGRPGHAARHPLHQRRLGRADDLAAAVPRPGRRRSRSAASTASSSSTRRSQQIDEESTLDLIVVGTQRRPDDGRGRRATRSPRTRCSRRSSSRTREISKHLRGASRTSRAQVGKPKWVDVELTAELEAAHGDADLRARSQTHGLREAGAVVEELVDELSPGDHDGLDRGGHRRAELQVRASLATILEKAAARGRRGPGPRAVRGRPARAHRRRAGLEGAQVGEARPALRPHRRRGRAAVPGRLRAGRGRAGGQGLA